MAGEHMAFDFCYFVIASEAVAICLSMNICVRFYTSTDFLPRYPTTKGDLRSHHAHGLKTGTIKRRRQIALPCFAGTGAQLYGGGLLPPNTS